MRKTGVNGVESLVQEVRDRLIGVRKSRVEKVLLLAPTMRLVWSTDLVEVLTTPFCRMFSSVSAASSAGVPYKTEVYVLKDGKVALSAHTGVIVNKRMSIFHRPPTSFVSVFAHSHSEGVFQLLVGRCLGALGLAQGRRYSRMTIESLHSVVLL